MKLGLFTLITPELTPLQAVHAAREYGYDGICLRVADVGTPAAGKINYWSGNRCSIPLERLAADLPTFVTAARDAKLEVPSLGAYFRHDQVDQIERLMRIMRDNGVKGLRIAGSSHDGKTNYRDQFAAMRRGYEHLETLARNYGVRACVEQHHETLAPTVSACMRLVDGLDPRHIGVILDPGNAVAEGFETYRLAVEMLGDYLAEVHVKNGIMVPAGRSAGGFAQWKAQWGGLRDGLANFEELGGVLRRQKFNGYLMLEDFSDRPMDVRLREGAAVMRQMADGAG